jgi:uncharacterized membrane protein
LEKIVDAFDHGVSVQDLADDLINARAKAREWREAYEDLLRGSTARRRRK